MDAIGRARRGVSCLLALAVVPSACGSSSKAGVRVELVSQQSVQAGQEFNARTGVVRVEEMRWTSSEVELQGCTSAYAAVKVWLIPPVHAHGTSTPTLLAVPTIVSELATGGTLLGELAPPAGRYCSLRYRVAPADADAVGLASTPGMLGTSFLLRGGFARAGAELQEFELVSERTIELTRDIELELSSDHPWASLLFGHDVERWFQDLDLGSLTAGAREEAILSAFRASFSVRVE